jgi:hypothetical protein
MPTASRDLVWNGNVWMYYNNGVAGATSLYRSYDNGDTWTACGPSTGSTNHIIWTGKYWLRIGTSFSTHYISSDNGDSWSIFGSTVLPITTSFGLFKNWNKSAYYP